MPVHGQSISITISKVSQMSLIIQDTPLIIGYEIFLHHLEIIGFILSTVFVDTIYVLNTVNVC
jgi:hypothetical protein